MPVTGRLTVGFDSLATAEFTAMPVLNHLRGDHEHEAGAIA